MKASHEAIRKAGFKFGSSRKNADGSYTYYYKHPDGRRADLRQTGDAIKGFQYTIKERR